MPIHDFKCKTCGTKFDEMYPPTVEEIIIPECPKCKTTENVVRVFSPPPVRFKGLGFTKARLT